MSGNVLGSHIKQIKKWPELASSRLGCIGTHMWYNVLANVTVKVCLGFWGRTGEGVFNQPGAISEGFLEGKTYQSVLKKSFASSGTAPSVFLEHPCPIYASWNVSFFQTHSNATSSPMNHFWILQLEETFLFWPWFFTLPLLTLYLISLHFYCNHLKLLFNTPNFISDLLFSLQYRAL